MAEQWVNIGTGETSSSNPALLSGGPPASPGMYNNGMYASQWERRWVPDPPDALSQVHVPMPYTTSGPGLLSWEDVRKVFQFLFVLVVLAVGVAIYKYVVEPFWSTNFSAMDKGWSPWPSVKEGVNYYTADQFADAWWHPHHEKAILMGRQNVVSGDLHDIHIDSRWNITFSGDITRVIVTAPFSDVHLYTAHDSSITARSITAGGPVVNTREKLTGRQPVQAGASVRRR